MMKAPPCPARWWQGDPAGKEWRMDRMGDRGLPEGRRSPRVEAASLSTLSPESWVLSHPPPLTSSHSAHNLARSLSPALSDAVTINPERGTGDSATLRLGFLACSWLGHVTGLEKALPACTVEEQWEEGSGDQRESIHTKLKRLGPGPGSQDCTGSAVRPCPSVAVAPDCPQPHNSPSTHTTIQDPKELVRAGQTFAIAGSVLKCQERSARWKLYTH